MREIPYLIHFFYSFSAFKIFFSAECRKCFIFASSPSFSQKRVIDSWGIGGDSEWSQIHSLVHWTVRELDNQQNRNPLRWLGVDILEFSEQIDIGSSRRETCIAPYTIFQQSQLLHLIRLTNGSVLTQHEFVWSNHICFHYSLLCFHWVRHQYHGICR